MNWDISFGQVRQWYGRALQALGRGLQRRQFVTEGKRLEAAGHLQTRFGLLKHRVQSGAALIPVQVRRTTADVGRQHPDRSDG